MDVEGHAKDLFIDSPDDVPTGTDVPNMGVLNYQQVGRVYPNMGCIQLCNHSRS